MIGPLLAASLLAPAAWCDRGGAVDLHVDTPFQVHYRGQPPRRPEGCVQGAVFSLFVPHRMERRDLPALLELLEAAEGIAGWPAVRYSVEGSVPLQGHLDAIPGLVTRGVVLFGLVHSRHNALAESSSDPHPHPPGLSDAGRAFVEAVYDAGALVDLSHASDATFADVAAIARARGKPLVATHSNARALADHHRNLTDAQLRAIADSDGLVGVAFHAPFLRQPWHEATARDVARHVAHMVEVMGVDHVAIGSDLDGLIEAPAGLTSHAAFPGIALALRAEGLSPAAVTKVMGANARRVVWTR